MRFFSTSPSPAAARRIAAVSIVLKTKLELSCFTDSEVHLGDLLKRDPLLSVCLIKRAKRDGDYWSGDVALPGGKAERGETSLLCAMRETYEELGLDLSRKSAFLHLGQGKTLDIGGGNKGLSVVPHVFIYNEGADSSPQFNLSQDEVDFAWFQPLDTLHPSLAGQRDHISIDVASRYITRYKATKDHARALFTQLLLNLTGVKCVQFQSLLLRFDMQQAEKKTEHLWGLTLRILSDSFGDYDAKSSLPVVRFMDNWVLDGVHVAIHKITSGRLGVYAGTSASIALYLCLPVSVLVLSARAVL